MKAKLTPCLIFVLFCTSLFSVTANATDFVFTAQTQATTAQFIETQMHDERSQKGFEVFTLKSSILGFDLGHGPFIAVQSGDNTAFDAVALGWRLDISRPNSAISGWNIGMGLVVEADFKALTRGLLTNDLDNNHNIHNRQSGGTGFIVMTSFSF
ncbi:MAG: hypothetical protein HRT35_06860 [Algicola sp.]|nr:hypothetical protein [Algicola sp.]